MHLLVNEWTGPIVLLLEALLELFFRNDSEFRRHALSDAVLIANCPLLNSALNLRNRKKSQMKKSQMLLENVPRPFTVVICKRLNISHSLMNFKLTQVQWLCMIINAVM
jgi:hypothetical protein